MSRRAKSETRPRKWIIAFHHRTHTHSVPALLVPATDTGKTRVAIALCDALIRAKWARRVLFLCDRRELRNQAGNELLTAEPPCNQDILWSIRTLRVGSSDFRVRRASCGNSRFLNNSAVGAAVDLQLGTPNRYTDMRVHETLGQVSQLSCQ
jgi:hypothetical protein